MTLRFERLVILVLLHFFAPCRADTVTIDDQDPSVTYTGHWIHWRKGDADTPTVEQAIGGPIPSNVNTLSFTNATSSPATITFQGTSISIVALRAKIGGTILITLNGTLMQSIELDLSGTSNTPKTVSISQQLPNGQHSLSVAKVVTSALSSQGSYVNLNYFSIEQPSVPPNNSNPPANSQPLPSATDTTANQQTSIAPGTTDASPIPSSSSNHSLSPFSSLSGQQNSSTAYKSPGSTGTANNASPSPASTWDMRDNSNMHKLFGAIGGIISLILLGIVILLLRRSRRRKVVRLKQKPLDKGTEPVVPYRLLDKNKLVVRSQAHQELTLRSRTDQALPATTAAAATAATTAQPIASATTGTTDINNESDRIHQGERSSSSAHANVTRRAEKAVLFLRMIKLRRKERLHEEHVADDSGTLRIDSTKATKNSSYTTVADLDLSAATVNEVLRNSRTSELPPVTASRHIEMPPLVEVDQLRSQMAAMQATIETQARHLSFLERIAEQGQRSGSDAVTECLPPYASN